MTSLQIKIYKQHSQKAKDIKSQEVKDLKVTTHQEYDHMGKLTSHTYVEFMVIGTNRTWPDFMTFNDFKKLNPKVAL